MGQWRIGERALRGRGAADKLGRCGEQPVALGADLGQSDLLVASDHKQLRALKQERTHRQRVRPARALPPGPYCY